MWRIISNLAVIAVLLQSTFGIPRSRLQDRDHNDKQVGYIAVSVATLWTNPSKPRSVDAPAWTNAAHIEEWLDAMTVKQSLDLTSDTRTQAQALYGNQIYILQSKDGWYEIAVPGQPTPKNTLG